MQLRDHDVVWQVVDDEVVILDLHTSEYLSVNRSGRLLWDRLVQGPASRDELVGLLVATYAVPTGVAEADVLAFLESLRARELLH